MISNALILYLQKHWKHPDSMVDLPIFLFGWICPGDTFRFARMLAKRLINWCQGIILSKKCYWDVTQEIQLLRINFWDQQNKSHWVCVREVQPPNYSVAAHGWNSVLWSGKCNYPSRRHSHAGNALQKGSENDQGQPTYCMRLDF